MQIYSIKRLDEVVELPIPLAEIKLFLKIDNELEDNLLRTLMFAAIFEFESYTSRALLAQRWQVMYKDFSAIEVMLPVRPISKIDSIISTYDDGQERILSSHAYKVIGDHIAFYMLGTVPLLTIKYTVGYGDSLIPEDLKMLLLDNIAYTYENRGGTKQFPINRYDRFRYFKS